MPRLFGCVALLLLAPTLIAQEKAEPIKGVRVFHSGHSFHYFMPNILVDIAEKAGVKDHVKVGLSAIGGSRTIQHWDVAQSTDKFKMKENLEGGKVDVLTLAPIFLPDEGIENFVNLAFKHNPDIKITIQEFWLPNDRFGPIREKGYEHNKATRESLRKEHEPYFKSIDDHVVELNKKLGKTVVYVAPVGQAVLALREKIMEGKAPGLKEQEDLFTDPLGHAKPPLQTLVAYVHFASIYGRTPVGLPLPEVLNKARVESKEELNRLLQELAWEAVTSHALSGVKK